ncbi:hypothetical protein GCM10020358_58080 [Amorphoplanes nipponensis]|uniref:Uncharacterized protein n=1 Tax=Actinoplanes nipponensis TaxID=135950 RepID=A0A919JL07_9ACTN|nr:hypothetical protein Ani05nite_60450 [Actinoplanes nipponensis]
MGRHTFGGRVAVDRAGVAAHTSAARRTVNLWHRNRATTGFPDGFTDDSGREWFWLDQITAFHTAHQKAKLAELTTIDRSGDPDELVGSGEAAKILRYGSYRNLPDQLRDQPDDIEILSDGRLRRRWYRRTVWAIADARTGRQSTGRTPGTTNSVRKPHPYADDPRLQTAAELLAEAREAGRDRRGLGVELARRLGTSQRTAQRLLTVAESDQPS